MTPVVRAAGGVVLRDGPGGREVLLIHRRRYGDWTLPKGKCDPGEPDVDCAVREVEEETGLVCELLDEVGSTEYVDGKDRPKQVRYWAMRVVGGELRPAPPEVDEVLWVPLGQARKPAHLRIRRGACAPPPLTATASRATTPSGPTIHPDERLSVSMPACPPARCPRDFQGVACRRGRGR